MASDDLEGESNWFAKLYAEYSDDVYGKRLELSAPDEFDRREWDTLGYMPPEDRGSNEVYGWSKFYDFFWWLYENDYVDEEAIQGVE